MLHLAAFIGGMLLYRGLRTIAAYHALDRANRRATQEIAEARRSLDESHRL